MGLLSFYAAMALGLSVLMMPQAVRTPEDESLDRLLDAIALVESRGNAGAVGDDGRAVGVYQIHRSYWVEGTGILGVNWEYRDATDPQKARQVVRAYLSHYGRGRPLLDLARIHNGGPQGHRKASTLAYARKVEQILNERR